MSRREKIDKVTDGNVPSTALGLLRALIEASQNQAQSLEALKQRMDAEAHESSVREAEQAALLGEVRCELAETGAALETDILRRQAAERAAAELEAVVARVWEVLPPKRPAEMRSPCDGAPAPATVDTSTDVAPGAGPVADTGAALGGAAELGKAEDATVTSRVSAKDDAGAANDAPAQRTSLQIDLNKDEVEALARLAGQRGRGTEDFVTDLVRRELREASARQDAGPAPRAKVPRNWGGRELLARGSRPPDREFRWLGAVARF